MLQQCYATSEDYLVCVENTLLISHNLFLPLLIMAIHELKKTQKTDYASKSTLSYCRVQNILHK